MSFDHEPPKRTLEDPDIGEMHMHARAAVAAGFRTVTIDPRHALELIERMDWAEKALASKEGE